MLVQEDKRQDEQRRRQAPPAVPWPAPTWYDPVKAAADFVLAFALLVVALPVMLLAALAVKLTSPGPVIYAQVRLGRRGRPYKIYKIRTMHDNCEGRSGARWSCPGDPRVTPVGRFLRRTHLDELPQLWNVLKGEMSLIGPRPERPELVPPLEQAIPRYRERLAVRPGVTGLAQVQLPADTDLDSVRQKLRYDLYYVEHYGPWMDLRVLLATPFTTLGLPFAAARKLFGLPARAAVERAYGPADLPPAVEPPLHPAWEGA